MLLQHHEERSRAFQNRSLHQGSASPALAPELSSLLCVFRGGDAPSNSTLDLFTFWERSLTNLSVGGIFLPLPSFYA